jgi:Arc/MetJ family transcription regulator
MNDSDFVSKSGTTYQIDVDDALIRVRSGDVDHGRIELTFVEGEPERGMPHTYKIVNLALENCTGEGVGRECLLRHKEAFGCPITAGPDDGSRCEDGSHLIENGPGFIKKMRAEGIVVPSFSARYDEEYADRFDRDD